MVDAFSEFNVILPEIEEIELVDQKTKRHYKVSFFVPAAITLVIIKNIDVLKKLVAGKEEDNWLAGLDDEVMQFMWEIFGKMFGRQYPLMTAQWCEDNIDIFNAWIILSQIINPLLEFMQTTGLMESVTPEKKPLAAIQENSGSPE